MCYKITGPLIDSLRPKVPNPEPHASWSLGMITGLEVRLSAWACMDEDLIAILD